MFHYIPFELNKKSVTNLGSNPEIENGHALLVGAVLHKRNYLPVELRLSDMHIIECHNNNPRVNALNTPCPSTLV